MAKGPDAVAGYAVVQGKNRDGIRVLIGDEKVVVGEEEVPRPCSSRRCLCHEVWLRVAEGEDSDGVAAARGDVGARPVPADGDVAWQVIGRAARIEERHGPAICERVGVEDVKPLIEFADDEDTASADGDVAWPTAGGKWTHAHDRGFAGGIDGGVDHPIASEIGDQQPRRSHPVREVRVWPVLATPDRAAPGW